MSFSRRQWLQGMAALTAAALPASSFARWAEKAEKHTPVPDSDDYWKKVRAAFPLTDQLTYFNNGTMGPSPGRVLDKVKASMDKVDTFGEYLTNEAARPAIARLINAKVSEISLTHNTTEAINLAVWGVPLKRNDEVIITTHEHVGSAMPWLNRAKLDGIRLKTFEPARTAAENIDRISRLISRRTRVIAIPHIICTTGLVLPIKAVSEICRAKNIFLLVDGAHAPGAKNVDINSLGVDCYSSCCHKWMLAPKGTAFLYVREAMLDRLQAYHVGAYSDTGWDMTVQPPYFKGYVPTAHRYDYGTQNASLAEGVKEAVDFLEEIGLDKVEQRTHALALRLQNGLLETGKIELLSAEEEASRCMMIGFRVKGMDFKAFNEVAARNKFRIRIVPEANLNSLRVSTHIYNQEDEVDRFIEMVRKLA
jgi:L-cysteine/cystine lyase